MFGTRTVRKGMLHCGGSAGNANSLTIMPHHLLIVRSCALIARKRQKGTACTKEGCSRSASGNAGGDAAPKCGQPEGRFRGQRRHFGLPPSAVASGAAVRSLLPPRMHSQQRHSPAPGPAHLLPILSTSSTCFFWLVKYIAILNTCLLEMAFTAMHQTHACWSNLPYRSSIVCPS